MPQYLGRGWPALSVVFICRQSPWFSHAHLSHQDGAIATKQAMVSMLNSLPGHGGLTLVDETNLEPVTHQGRCALLAIALAPCKPPWSARRLRARLDWTTCPAPCLLWTGSTHGQAASCTTCTLPDFPGDEASWAVALYWGWDDAAPSHPDKHLVRRGATYAAVRRRLLLPGRDVVGSKRGRILLTVGHCIAMACVQVPIQLALVFLYYRAGQHSLDFSFNRVVSLEHPVRAPRRLISSRTPLTPR